MLRRGDDEVSAPVAASENQRRDVKAGKSLAYLSGQAFNLLGVTSFSTQMVINNYALAPMDETGHFIPENVFRSLFGCTALGTFNAVVRIEKNQLGVNCCGLRRGVPVIS